MEKTLYSFLEGQEESFLIVLETHILMILCTNLAIFFVFVFVVDAHILLDEQ
jgi:hypothetical protein